MLGTTGWRWTIGGGLLGAALGAILVAVGGPTTGLAVIAGALVVGGAILVEPGARLEASAWSVGTAALFFNVSARLASDAPSWILAAAVCAAGAAAAWRADPGESTSVAVCRAAGIVGLILAVTIAQAL